MKKSYNCFMDFLLDDDINCDIEKINEVNIKKNL